MAATFSLPFRQSRRRIGRSLAVVALGAFTVFAGEAPTFKDPLGTPAAAVQGAPQPTSEPLIAVSASRGRTLAVGLRGLAIYSETDGVWRQAAVPVQADLVSVQLTDAGHGWAAGHDGVLLRSDDRGASWRKVFDLNDSKVALPVSYEKRLAAGEAGIQRYLNQLKLNTEGDVSLPFLGVWFDDANTGYAVGSFGMIISTADGGTTWSPWLDRIDNDEFLNLNSIRGIDGQVYAVGERGRVYRLDRQRQRFAAIDTGYKGTFFDIVGTRRVLVAFGLRGAAYRSTDRGATWEVVSSGVESSITAGVVLDEGRRIVLLTETGQAVQSTDDGVSFQPLQIASPTPAYAASVDSHGRLVVVGYAGVQVHEPK